MKHLYRLFLAVFLATLLLGSLQNVSRVYAAGEAYSWEAHDKIKISGGDVKGTTITITAVIAGGFERALAVHLTHSSGCAITIDFQLQEDQKSLLLSVPDTFSDNSCDLSIRDSYAGTTVQISGTRPGADPNQVETEAQKKVNFSFYYPGLSTSAPASLPMVITGTSNSTSTISRVLEKISSTAGLDRPYAAYRAMGNFEAGNYKVCFKVAGTDICKDFVKEKFFPTRVEWGSNGVLGVVWKITYKSVGETFDNHSIPALNFTLTSLATPPLPVQTFTTEPITGTGFSDDGSLPTPDDSFTNVKAYFSGVLSGNYRVCVDGYPDTCKEFTKTDKASPQSEVINLDDTDGFSSGIVTVGNGTSTDGTDSCESLGGVMSWIACPLINIADNTTSYLDNQITSLLQVPESAYKDNAELKQTWETIRNVALIVLVPIMLVMVLSTALGFDFIDAYTIKKALPRLVVAVMFIVLSWWITIFLLDLTNDVGKGILGLMTRAFGGPDGLTLAKIFSPTAAQGVISAGGTIAAGALFLNLLITGGGLGIVASFAFTTVVALFLGFLVLTIRQMLLVALILFGPLAILSWIFPNNNKMWKLWWESFSKLLLMFPIIMIIIAAGRIFASVVGSTGPSIINTLLKLIAYIAPYFFIPATFKIAGSLFATLSGVVNDRGKGIFDRGKKYRHETMKATKKRASAGTRWGDSRMGKLANKSAMWTAEPGQNAGYKLGKRGVPGLKRYAANINSYLANEGISESLKVVQKLNETGMFNDKAYRALMGGFNGFNDKDVRQGLIDKGFMDAEGKTLRTASTLKDFNDLADIMATAGTTERARVDADGNLVGNQDAGSTERIAANALRGQAGYLASVHTDAETTHASVQAAGAFGLASHGFADGNDLADLGNYIGDPHHGHGGPEFAHAVVTKAQVLGQGQRPDIKAGYGVLFDPESGTFKNGLVDYEVDANGEVIKEVMTNDRGEVITELDGTQRTKAKEVVSQRAMEWYGTVKQNDWMGAKAPAVKKAKPILLKQATETVKNADGSDAIATYQQDVINPETQAVVHRAGEQVMVKDKTGAMVPQKVYTARALAAQEQITLGASAYSGSDLDAKVEWKDVAQEIPGLSSHVQQADQARAMLEEPGKINPGGGPSFGGPAAPPSFGGPGPFGG